MKGHMQVDGPLVQWNEEGEGLSEILCKRVGVTSTDLVRGLETITHDEQRSRWPTRLGVGACI
jgi:hypothetical protein